MAFTLSMMREQNERSRSQFDQRQSGHVGWRWCDHCSVILPPKITANSCAVFKPASTRSPKNKRRRTTKKSADSNTTAKATPKNRRRVAGKLSGLMQVPIDIFIEVRQPTCHTYSQHHALNPPPLSIPSVSRSARSSGPWTFCTSVARTSSFETSSFPRTTPKGYGKLLELWSVPVFRTVRSLWPSRRTAA